ncbi:hypothetical protein FA15DRAFT_588508 [Coprinopsis marcescibilis]|uniref:Exonuclease domain-containing protein n=1 Tax=Coprinopsis marcescibilis TaxID=230819 RepID=A0A5C3L0D0_COPMA|nr:hypothetical protein FA15DRAFT_588508 [Coprinopsis marcescibilis]
MRHPRPPRHIRKRQAALAAAARVIPAVKAKQLFDVFLVLDIEGTCNRGSDFDFPNEIIEFPVCLMAWQDKDVDMRASQLEVVDEFRSFVRPTWRPTLSDFCVELTGISQEQVDSAPTFPEVVEQFESFLTSNGLIDENGERLVRFCWCTDGPFDIRDFIVKQCFISMIPIPHWLKGNVCDVRTLVLQSINRDIKAGKRLSKAYFQSTNRRLLNISTQLEELGLPMFEGRQHSGIDDTRNITRILAELGRRGVPILPNTTVEQNKRWPWMGKRGQVLEEYVK